MKKERKEKTINPCLEYCVKVTDLEFAYDHAIFKEGFTLIENNFSVPKGYITGLAGKNGTGKTTLLKRLACADYRKGTVKALLNGKCLDIKEFPLEVKNQIGFVTEETFFLKDKTLFENGKIFGGFYENFDFTEYADWLRRFEMETDSLFQTLSRGMKKKAQFAFCLAYRPLVLLLDEPTAGLDPIFREQFLYLLQDYVSDGEHSVLFSTQITEDLDRIGDYVMFMKREGNYGTVSDAVEIESFLEQFLLVRCKAVYYERLKKRYGEKAAPGLQKRENFYNVLTKGLTRAQLEELQKDDAIEISRAKIEDIL